MDSLFSWWQQDYYQHLFVLVVIFVAGLPAAILDAKKPR
jgi:hypothetical protein